MGQFSLGSTESGPLIRLSALSKEYNDKPVFSGISGEINRGDFICIVGPSGSGKTTLLRCLLGAEKISSGAIYQQKDDIRFTYVPQQPTLLPWLTALENVKTGILPGDFVQKGKAEEVFRLVGLAGNEHSLPRQLSGGMQQRVSLARALVSTPDIVFLDEPFSALDEMRRADLSRLAFDLWESSGVTFVMNTHSIDDACILSTRVWIMSPYVGGGTRGGSLQILETWPRGTPLDARRMSGGHLKIKEAIEGALFGINLR